MAQDNGSNGDSARKVPAPERPGVPRWVKVFGLIALAIAIILAVLMLLGVEHGPGLHSLAEFRAGSAPASLALASPAPALPAPAAGTAL
ncbi:MAG: hypothetical protein ACLGIS_17760 [Actinomycetes bacterium]